MAQEGNLSMSTKVKEFKGKVDGGGRKFDSKKNRLELIPPEAIEELGWVYTFGAEKYAPNNWLRGINYTRIIGAIKRHVLEIEKSQDYDPEWGLLHAGHAAWSLIALIYFMKHPERYKKFDDRVFK